MLAIDLVRVLLGIVAGGLLYATIIWKFISNEESFDSNTLILFAIFVLIIMFNI